jgi:hypothetical protein
MNTAERHNIRPRQFFNNVGILFSSIFICLAQDYGAVAYGENLHYVDLNSSNPSPPYIPTGRPQPRSFRTRWMQTTTEVILWLRTAYIPLVDVQHLASS